MLGDFSKNRSASGDHFSAPTSYIPDSRTLEGTSANTLHLSCLHCCPTPEDLSHPTCPLDRHHSKVAPAQHILEAAPGETGTTPKCVLLWGEGKITTHTPVHLQSQQLNFIANRAERIPCQSVLEWKQACVLAVSSTC